MTRFRTATPIMTKKGKKSAQAADKRLERAIPTMMPKAIKQESQEEVSDSYTNYDAKGHKTGESYSNGVGYSHYDTKGHKTGESNWAPGGYDHNNRTSGCYIATCVYGSYDCPEVWTLRRFRDEKLLPTVPGRWFVKCYYKLSPKLVERYGRKAWFVKPWRRLLDWAVSRLK